MKKITYEKWISTFVQNLCAHFNLQGWRVSVEFCPEPKEDSEGCWSEINSDSVYMQAPIRVYPKLKESWEEGDTDRISEVLVHELAHILVDPLHEHACPFLSETTSPMFNKILENVVQRITGVILNSLPKSLIPPR